MTSPLSHRPPRHWLKISVTCPRQLAELVNMELSGITACGTENISVEQGTMVIGYLEKDEQYQKRRGELDLFLNRIKKKGEATWELTTIVEENWAEKWQEQFKPSKISDRFTVCPSWLTHEPAPDEKVIIIDPGLAFGTGLHASTRLALRHLERVLASPTPGPVLDVGTGTGILAIAAKMLGATPVIGIDNDPDAVAAGQANIILNSQEINISTTPLAEIPGTFQLVLANITADVLTSLSQELARHLAPGGHLILAGILAGGQGKQISATFQGLGLTVIDEEQQGEWTSLLLRKEQQ
ncbi:MAG: 50S ribosomal protein L11 methyltransferase [Thermodesulfobacteriota bacterium]